MENRKSYYAIIPANVRYCENLPPNAKLLYGEITALCNEKGYCWATNHYFAELYNVHKKTISSWIHKLKENGFIKINELEENGNIQRQMFINEIMDTYKSNHVPPSVKSCTPIRENMVLNNTSINTTNNTLIEINNKNFESFWNNYGHTGNKQKAKIMWERAIKETSPAHLDERLVVYLNFIKKTNTFQKHASTWLNPKYKEFDNEYDISKFNNTSKNPFDEHREKKNLINNEAKRRIRTENNRSVRDSLRSY